MTDGRVNSNSLLDRGLGTRFPPGWLSDQGSRNRKTRIVAPGLEGPTQQVVGHVSETGFSNKAPLWASGNMPRECVVVSCNGTPYSKWSGN
jgi:hypothetical protein